MTQLIQALRCFLGLHNVSHEGPISDGKQSYFVCARCRARVMWQ